MSKNETEERYRAALEQIASAIVMAPDHDEGGVAARVTATAMKTAAGVALGNLAPPAPDEVMLGLHTKLPDGSKALVSGPVLRDGQWTYDVKALTPAPAVAP